MSRLPYRGSIALAAVVVVLLTSRPADAQVGGPGPPRQHGGFMRGLIVGAWVDRADKSSAEWHLEHRQAKLRRDAERGNAVAADRDVRRIDRLQNRIEIDEWLLQKNLYDCTGYYPFPVRLDRQTYCAIGQYHTPPRPPGRW